MRKDAILSGIMAIWRTRHDSNVRPLISEQFNLPIRKTRWEHDMVRYLHAISIYSLGTQRRSDTKVRGDFRPPACAKIRAEKEQARAQETTKRIVDAADVREKDYVVWDGERRGFGLRVQQRQARHARYPSRRIRLPPQCRQPDTLRRRDSRRHQIVVSWSSQCHAAHFRDAVGRARLTAKRQSPLRLTAGSRLSGR
jgi:hypothetical protein